MQTNQTLKLSNVIVGCESLYLSPAECELFAQYRPLGLILFARNIESPQQLCALVEQFKTHTQNPLALVLIDQEGGRVSRLPKAHWRVPPSPTVFARLYKSEAQKALRAMHINYQLIAHDLKACGVNVNCAPMLDIPQEYASAIVLERALGDCPTSVISLAQACISGLQSQGLEPVIKHAPGHGRGKTDSHKELPIVDASLQALKDWDFLPFKALNHHSMLMTAHILFTAIDARQPCTLSEKVITTTIREDIGFDGLIMTDDIDMHALQGNTAAKVAAAISAGCDVVLQCSGKIDDLRHVFSASQTLSGHALRRAQHAMQLASTKGEPLNTQALLAELLDLLGTVEHTS